jgi:phage terminase small subunit
MMAGRPRKSSALRTLEGGRSHSSEIPPEIPLDSSAPVLPPELDAVAAEHFTFMVQEFHPVGIIKKCDGPALAKLAVIWSQFWQAQEAGDINATCKLSQRWDAAASKLGITPVDRVKLAVGGQVKTDTIEETYFKVTG